MYTPNKFYVNVKRYAEARGTELPLLTCFPLFLMKCYAYNKMKKIYLWECYGINAAWGNTFCTEVLSDCILAYALFPENSRMHSPFSDSEKTYTCRICALHPYLDLF